MNSKTVKQTKKKGEPLSNVSGLILPVRKKRGNYLTGKK